MLHCNHSHLYTLRNKVFETHQIWCAFTVPPGTPDIVLLAHILVFCTHSCSGLSTPNLVCFYSTSQHTQSGVYSTPQVLCPEWPILECSTHPLWCVLYTRCRSVNCTLFTRVCFRHCSECCAHQVFTPNTVCNALIKLAVFNYACDKTNEKGCTFFVHTAKCKWWKHSPCLLYCAVFVVTCKNA